MADGKLYIIITTNPDGGSGGGSQAANTKAHTNNADSAFSKYLAGELAQLAKRTVNQVINFGIQQVGNLRGQYFEQQSLQNAQQIVNTTTNIIKGVATGAAAGTFFGPVGTAVGAAVGAGAEILNSLGDVAINLFNIAITSKKQNYEIEQLRIRAGLNSAYNGSRGTEN